MNSKLFIFVEKKLKKVLAKVFVKSKLIRVGQEMDRQ